MIKDKTGDQIPQVNFRTRESHEWKELSSATLFDNRTVVVFSLPGAFTPTCSSSHVPRYNQLASAFKHAGVDEVVCVSVNDAFVMNEWQEEQNAWNIRFLPDGNGEFTDQMGMLVGKEDLGFGRRSWRYSMLVKNGIIEKMFIEPVVDGDPYEVSDADTMLEYLAPHAAKPLDVVVLTRKGCGHCVRAKQDLERAGIAYEELILNRDFTDQALRALSSERTYPQVFIGGNRVGGADELERWLSVSRAA